MCKISIVLPIYNGAPFVARCLDSLLKQTLLDIEIICVDDGSIDDTFQILIDYLKRDARIKVIHQKNQGQGAARNRGIDCCIGEYIYFIDADDFLDRDDALERLYNCAFLHNLEMLFFEASVSYETTDADLKKIYPSHNYTRRRKYTKVYTGIVLLNLLLKNEDYFVSPCLFIMKRTFLQSSRVQFPVGMLYEDNIFTTSLLLLTRRVMCCRERCYMRTVTGVSLMTKGTTVQNVVGYLKCLAFVVDSFSVYKSNLAVKDALWILLRLYKRNLRKMVRKLSMVDATWKSRLSQEEMALLNEAMPYPLKDKILDLQSCYRRNGLFYTINRLVKIFLRKV